MRTNAKKLLVQRSPHKRPSKHSAGYSLAARMNVRSHQYDVRIYFSLKYRLQMDSVRLFAKHMPHKRMKANAVRLHVHIMRFMFIFAFVPHSHTDVGAA